MAASNVNVGTNSQELVSANTARIQLIISNSGQNGVFLNIGADAVSLKGVYLAPGAIFIMPKSPYFQSSVCGITASGESNVAILEL